MENKKVTMGDIAKEIGVSVVTVSKALSGKDGVSDEVRAEIQQKAAQLGYHYSPSGKGEEERGSGNIGVIVPDRFIAKDSTFYNNLYHTVVIKAGEKGYSGMLEIVSGRDEEECNLPLIVKNNKVDGVIFLGQVNRKYVEAVATTGMPFLLLDFYDEMYPVDSIVSDGVYGTYVLTNYLIEKGHRRIAFVGSVNATSSILDRYLGYYKSLLKNGIKLDEDLIIPDRDENSKFIDIRLPRKMPDAFVCNCDEVAFMLVNKLKNEGYRVPEDVSVVGFDDFTFATLCSPQLTTFRVDVASMAESAVGLMMRKLHRKKYTKGNTVIAGSLIVRDSVADRNI